MSNFTPFLRDIEDGAAEKLSQVQAAGFHNIFVKVELTLDAVLRVDLAPEFLRLADNRPQIRDAAMFPSQANELGACVVTLKKTCAPRIGLAHIQKSSQFEDTAINTYGQLDII
jgi:hypothetical protein